jgi:predicted NBD/HSP70 family sugar kinase
MIPLSESNITKVLNPLKPTARAFATLAFVSLILASSWVAVAVWGHLAGGPVLWVPPTAFAVLAGMFMLTAGFYSLRRDVGDIKDRLEFIHERIPPAFHIGCRIGRRRLECGVLEVVPWTTDLPSKPAEVRRLSDSAQGQLSEGALLRHADHGLFKRDDLYKILVTTIAEMFRITREKGREKARIASIGIAVPGAVHPDRGTFEGVVGNVPFRNGEDITGKVATGLLQQVDPKDLDEIFGTSDLEVMRDRIHLDNDVRCAARWLLVQNDKSWRDIGCIFAGSGVGAGLVIDRKVFYGNRFRAGEIGHVNLNAGSKFLLSGMKGRSLQPRKCSCGIEGYHFESLISIGGLGHLANVIDNGKLAQIRDAYKADLKRREQIETSSIDDADADGIIVLRALASHAYGDTVIIPEIPLDMPFLDLIRSKPISDYLACVVETYARLFSTGVAALLNALDVDHIALCGTIPEFLQHNTAFVNGLQTGIAMGTPGTQKGFSLDYGSMRNWAWRGAALLRCDPGYMRRRKPHA